MSDAEEELFGRVDDAEQEPGSNGGVPEQHNGGNEEQGPALSGEGGEGEEPADEDAAGEDEAAAEGGSEEGGSRDSSEEDSEEGNEYEADGFLGDEDGSAKRRRKRRKRARDFTLDEEDYDLLEDNQVKVRRPAERKRLKKRGGDEQGGGKSTGVKQLQASLFGDDDIEDELDELRDGGEEGRERERRRDEGDRAPPRGDEFFDEEDEMADFIDDGDDGAAARARRRRRGSAAAEAGLSSRAMQEAAAIFGNVDDLLDLYASKRAEGAGAGGAGDEAGAGEGGEEGGEDEALREEDFDDLDAAQAYKAERAAAARAKRLAAQLSRLDPALVAAHHLAPSDAAIRSRDAPERLQLHARAFNMLARLNDENKAMFFDQASEWVTAQLFGPGAPQRRAKELVEEGVVEVQGLPPEAGDDEEGPAALWRADDLERAVEDLDLRNNKALLAARRGPALDRWRGDSVALQDLRRAVHDALLLLFDRQEEVPIVGMYRREAVGPLLSMRRSDEPKVTGRDYEASARFPTGTIQPKHRRIRRYEVLWAVRAAGLRYMALTHRRALRNQVYNDALDVVVHEGAKDGVAGALKALAECELEAGIDDCDAKFALAMALDGSEAAESERARRPARGGGGARRLLAGPVAAMAHRCALSASQYAENIDQEDRVNEPDDPRQPPPEFLLAEAAALVAAGQWPLREALAADAAALQREVTLLLATELAAEPALRLAVRMLFYKTATVTTAPTESGASVLDAFHRYGIAKRLVAKRVDTFGGSDLYLRVHEAAAAGLITATMDVAGGRLEEKVLSPLIELYTNQDASDLAGRWNAFRAGIVRTAVVDLLLPLARAQTQARLLAEAREQALGDAADRLWKVVRRPPLRLQVVYSEDEPASGEELPAVEAPRVAAVVWGQGAAPGGGGKGGGGGGAAAPQATVMVQLDGAGGLVDFVTLPQLSGAIPRSIAFNPVDDPKKARDAARVRDKVLEHMPHALVVGMGAPPARQLKEDLEKVLQYTQDNNGRKFRDELETQRVECAWGDEALAALWAATEEAGREFPEHSPLVRRAVGLGRLALDPLAVVGALCGPSFEVGSLKLHDCQDRLAREDLQSMVEQVMVTAVCQVGADINAMAAAPWRASTLQFVAGLGPRKAAMLLRTVQHNDNHVLSRLDLRAQAEGGGGGDDDGDGGDAGATHVLGRRVFANAAPVLRVRAGALPALANAEFDAADDLRVPPDMELALQRLTEAAVGSVNVEAALEEGRPQLLALNLWDLAGSLGLRHRLGALLDVHAELLAPYGELRQERAFSEEEVFYALHGETPDSFKEGRLVEARVAYVSSSWAKCIIQPGGIEAVLPAASASTSAGPNVDLRDCLQRDQVLTARVAFIGEDDDETREGPRRFLVRLTTRSADVGDARRWEQLYCKDREPSYHIQTEEEVAAEAREARRARGGGLGGARSQPFLRRPIDHPLYRHEKMTEAGDRLSDQSQPVGSAVFRPNTRSSVAAQLGAIGLTVKLHAGPDTLGVIIRHEELKESPKPQRQLKIQFPLLVEVPGMQAPAAYDDLDEVLARHVAPMVEHMRTMAKFRKFLDRKKEEVDAEVLKEAAASRQVGYRLAFDYAKPGAGYLAYSFTGRSVHHEYWLVTPQGYWFRGHMCRSPEEVVNQFKRDPQRLKRQAMGVPPPGALPPAPAYGGAPGGGGAPPPYWGGVPGGGYGGQPPMQQQAPPPVYAGHAPPVQAYGGGGGGGFYPVGGGGGGGGYAPGGGYGGMAPAAAGPPGGYQPQQQQQQQQQRPPMAGGAPPYGYAPMPQQQQQQQPYMAPPPMQQPPQARYQGGGYGGGGGGGPPGPPQGYGPPQQQQQQQAMGGGYLPQAPPAWQQHQR